MGGLRGLYERVREIGEFWGTGRLWLCGGFGRGWEVLLWKELGARGGFLGGFGEYREAGGAERAVHDLFDAIVEDIMHFLEPFGYIFAEADGGGGVFAAAGAPCAGLVGGAVHGRCSSRRTGGERFPGRGCRLF